MIKILTKTFQTTAITNILLLTIFMVNGNTCIEKFISWCKNKDENYRTRC